VGELEKIGVADAPPRDGRSLHEPRRAWVVAMLLVLAVLDVLAFELPLQWRRPELLWALLGVPLLPLGVALGWWRRERATKRFGDAGTLASLVAGRGAGFRVARATLLVLALQMLVVSLAGPRYGSHTRILHKKGIDVVIALDFSKSMLARDVRPNRIERAKAELVRWLDDLDGDRVGVVAFAGETMEFPMTVDYAAVGLFLRDLGPYDMPVGGTALGRALVSSGRLLERSRRRPGPDEDEQDDVAKVVILMTDGEDHEGDPVAAARDLAAQGVKVYTIGIGSRSGEPIPTYASDGTWTGYVRDEDGDVVHTALTAENEEQLQEIAEATGGRYFRAREGGVGMAQIRREMRALQAGERESRRVTVHEDRYALVLLPVLLLLVLESLLPEAWIGRRRRRRDRADQVREDARRRERMRKGGKR